jgi:predicted RNA binding protein YcfA (HicA-like mRNA interferase family)/predicted RNase H-like HicB family nuclease
VKVREIIRTLEDDGWLLVRTRGSHHQYKHPMKPGLVTVPANRNDELAPGTLNSIMNRIETMKKYLVVIEETSTGYSAYSPDLEGRAATGQTREEVEKNMQEVIEFHLEGLRLEGFHVPQPHTYSTYVEVPA